LKLKAKQNTDSDRDFRCHFNQCFPRGEFQKPGEIKVWDARPLENGR